MKTRIFTLATAVAVCTLMACNGSGNGTATDSTKTDTSSMTTPAATDTMGHSMDSSAKKDTSSMPK